MPFILPGYQPIMEELTRCLAEGASIRQVYDGWPETQPKKLPYAVIGLEEVTVDNSHACAVARHVYTIELAIVKAWETGSSLDRQKIEACDGVLGLIMDRNGVLNGQIAYMPMILGVKLNAVSPQFEEVVCPVIQFEVSYDQSKLNDTTGTVVPADQ